MDTKAIIEASLKAEIIKAFNNAPEAIDKMLSAILNKECYENGSFEKGSYTPYDAKKLPYIDWLVGQEVRRVAELAVREIVADNKDKIRASVAQRMSADDLVDAFAKHLIQSADQNWRINVKFAPDKD